MTTHLRLHEIAESRHRILNPFTHEKLMLLGEIVAPTPATRILDLACGKAELLAQWSARYGCGGTGVDISDVFLAAARERVAELGVADRVELVLGDAKDHVTDTRHDVVSCIGASWFAGGIEPSLRMMRGWGTPDATLLLGEPFWNGSPPPDVRRPYAEFTTLAGTFERIEAVGLEVVEMVLADQDSWDRYAAASWLTLHDWLRDHPGDPEYDAVRERLVESRRSYVGGEREFLGWGVFVLRAAP